MSEKTRNRLILAGIAIALLLFGVVAREAQVRACEGSGGMVGTTWKPFEIVCIYK